MTNFSDMQKLIINNKFDPWNIRGGLSIETIIQLNKINSPFSLIYLNRLRFYL